MTRLLHLGGWFAAVNAMVMATTLMLAGGGQSVPSGVRTFAGWCGIG